MLPGSMVLPPPELTALAAVGVLVGVAAAAMLVRGLRVGVSGCVAPVSAGCLARRWRAETEASSFTCWDAVIRFESAALKQIQLIGAD